jgi:Zn finger protein HypA/HybF involved in hydrogenase expression
MPKPRKEFVCLDCDWIGSPVEEPVECPNCLSPNLAQLDVGDEEEADAG